MNAQEQATVLLAIRVVAAIILFAVLVKQVINLHTTKTDYPKVRWAVFAGTLILFFGQFIPGILDAVVAFGNFYEGRNPRPKLLASSYAFNNAVKDLVMGALLAILHFNPSTRSNGNTKDHHSVL